jgi:hypothetical protein
MNAPTVTKHLLDDAVRALAKKDRPATVALLAKFGALTTPELPPEQWQAVYEACVEALAALSKLDARVEP